MEIGERQFYEALGVLNVPIENVVRADDEGVVIAFDGHGDVYRFMTRLPEVARRAGTSATALLNYVKTDEEDDDGSVTVQFPNVIVRRTRVTEPVASSNGAATDGDLRAEIAELRRQVAELQRLAERHLGARI